MINKISEEQLEEIIGFGIYQYLKITMNLKEKNDMYKIIIDMPKNEWKEIVKTITNDAHSYFHDKIIK